MPTNNLLNFPVKYSRCRTFYIDKTSIWITLTIVISLTSRQRSDSTILKKKKKKQNNIFSYKLSFNERKNNLSISQSIDGRNQLRWNKTFLTHAFIFKEMKFAKLTPDPRVSNKFLNTNRALNISCFLSYFRKAIASCYLFIHTWPIIIISLRAINKLFNL